MSNPALHAFIQQTAQLAQRAGIRDLAIVLIDPVSGDGMLFATDAAKANLRDTVSDKFGFDGAEAETFWP